MKRGLKIAAVTAIYLALASGAVAQMPEITEKLDPALGVTLFAPKKVKSVGVNQGLLKMDRISWRVYPIIYQTMDKAHKQAAMQIDILGPLNGGFTYASLAVNIDGQVVSGPVTWTAADTIFGDNAVSTKEDSAARRDRVVSQTRSRQRCLSDRALTGTDRPLHSSPQRRVSGGV